VILGVDRLDHTKGINERLAAFRTLLASGRFAAGEAVGAERRG
jgi:trehalose 6-phosphate synthase